MTEREKQIIKALLEVLKRMGGPTHEPILLNTMDIKLDHLMKSEFDEAVRFCDAEGWLTGITGPMGNRKWSISERGRVALIEMR